MEPSYHTVLGTHPILLPGEETRVILSSARQNPAMVDGAKKGVRLQRLGPLPDCAPLDGSKILKNPSFWMVDRPFCSVFPRFGASPSTAEGLPGVLDESMPVPD